MAFNAQRNDRTKFTEGAWVPMMGAEFKLARAGNPDYEKALEESGYRKQEDPQDKMRALHQAVAIGILKDWRDVVDANGDEIPFTVDNAIEVLADNPDLMNKIIAESNDLSHYRREDVAEQAKKRRTTSGS